METTNMEIFKRVTDLHELSVIYPEFIAILSELTNYYPTKTIQDELKIYSEKYFLSTYSKGEHHALGLYLNSELIGYVLMYIESGICFIQWVGVIKALRGMGYGKQLYLRLEDYLLKQGNVHKIFLDTICTNVEAIKTVDSVGFKKICKLEKHWDMQDYYLWEKVIS